MSLPDGMLAGSALGVSVTLGGQGTVLLASSSETSEFTVLHSSAADPIDTRITTDSRVAGINHDDFVVFVSSILIDEIRVQDSEVGASSSSSFFSIRSQRTDSLLLQDTLSSGLTIDNTLGNHFLSATSSNTNTVNNITLLSLVA